MRVILSREALLCVKKSEIPDSIDIYDDEDEWKSWKRMGDPVLHIELRKWGDVFLLFPTSANYIAKIHASLSDDLVTCVCKAWPAERKPLILFPSVHPYISRNKLHSLQLETLESTQKLKIIESHNSEEVVHDILLILQQFS